MENYSDTRFDNAVRVVCEKIRKYLKLLPADIKKQAQEIRLRVNQPVSICCTNGIYFLKQTGRIACYPDQMGMMVQKSDLEESFRNICSYSIYSHQNEIRNGYITLAGGHRVGISGTAVCQSGQVSGVRDISSVNLRIAREIPGAADEIINHLKDEISQGLLIVGAPASGKTTILRDIIRQLSNGARGEVKKVVAIDERGELAGTWRGEAQNNMGACCDILDGYPKAEGILQAIRSLSPEFIVCDELGGLEDTTAVEQGLNAGVAMVSSIHAGSIEQLMRREQAVRLLKTGAFGYVALLGSHSAPGKCRGIYKAGDLLAQMDRGGSADRGGDACGVYGVA